MNNHTHEQPEPTIPTVRIIKPHQFDANTAQTPGMQRLAAVSRELAGSQGIWGGITIVSPNTASGIHHHGEIETIIYVVSGHGKSCHTRKSTLPPTNPRSGSSSGTRKNPSSSTS